MNFITLSLMLIISLINCPDYISLDKFTALPINHFKPQSNGARACVSH